MAFRVGIETSRFSPDHVVQILTGAHHDGPYHSRAVLFFRCRRPSSCAFVSAASAGSCSCRQCINHLVPAPCWHRPRLPFVLPAQRVLKQPLV